MRPRNLTKHPLIYSKNSANIYFAVSVRAPRFLFRIFCWFKTLASPGYLSNLSRGENGNIIGLVTYRLVNWVFTTFLIFPALRIFTDHMLILPTR